MRREKNHCVANGIRIQAIGKRDRLDPAVVRDIEAAEHQTARGQRLLLRIALDYSSRKEILRAFAEGSAPGPDVDLLLGNRARWLRLPYRRSCRGRRCGSRLIERAAEAHKSPSGFRPTRRSGIEPGISPRCL